MDSWKVYLLECADSTYYCGVAKYIDRRLAQHNGLQAGGARYTRSRRPVKLLAFTVCDDKKSAYRLEYAIKNTPREKKLNVLLAYESKIPAPYDEKGCGNPQPGDEPKTG